MTLNNAEMQDLTPDARLDAGRAWNAWVRMKRAEAEVASARQDFMALAIKLRGGHGLSVRKLGRVLGLSKDRIARYTAALEAENYGGPLRVKEMTPRERQRRGRWARDPDKLAGMRVAPGTEPSVARTASIVREVTGS